MITLTGVLNSIFKHILGLIPGALFEKFDVKYFSEVEDPRGANSARGWVFKVLEGFGLKRPKFL